MKHILIADDDEFLTSMYQLSLKKGGSEVTVVHDGKQALDVIEKSAPDLLILDLLMPILDGFAVLKALKEKGHTFPVIILSNLQDQMDRAKALELGAADFFCKSSLDLDGLVQKVGTYL